MVNLKRYRFSVALACLATSALLTGCGGDDDTLLPDQQQLIGGSHQVSGATVTSWARIGEGNAVTEVGVTVPMQVIQNPPAPEEGIPEATVAVLPFPAAVTSTTFVNHFNMGWNPNGHSGPGGPQGLYSAPHFDLHFYNITEHQTHEVHCADTTLPAANRLPTGYSFGPAPECVPHMGYHASPATDVPGGQFTATIVQGYYGGKHTFIEPMVTRAHLLQKQTFSMNVPRPDVLGQATRYPTRFHARFDAQANAYHFVLTDFVSATQ